MKKVGLIALGCAKNRVDAEVLLGILQQRGYQICNDLIDGKFEVTKENCHEVIEDMRSLADEIVTKLILPYEDRIKFDLVDEE